MRQLFLLTTDALPTQPGNEVLTFVAELSDSARQAIEDGRCCVANRGSDLCVVGVALSATPAAGRCAVVFRAEHPARMVSVDLDGTHTYAVVEPIEDWSGLAWRESSQLLLANRDEPDPGRRQ